MTFQLVDTLPEDRWQAFVDHHPQANVFHTPAMQAAFARVSGYQPLLRAALAEDGRVVALLTGTEIHLFGGPLTRLTSSIVAYGGVLSTEGEEGQQALGALLRWHNEISGRHALFTELRHRSDATSLRATLSTAGYEHDHELNYLIELSRPAEEILPSFGRSVRRNVRLAQRDGLVVEEVTKSEQLKTFYRLLRQVYSNAQVPLADISLFEAMFDVMRPLGLARFLIAQSPEGPAGARLALLYRGVIFDWYAGAERQLRSFYPNEFLVWHLMEWGARHGYHTFDFGGAGHPDVPYGVRDFKSRFGGRLVNFGRARCVHAPRLLHLSEAAYGCLRRLRLL